MIKIAITFAALAFVFYASSLLLYKVHKDSPEFGTGLMVILAGLLGTFCLGAAVVAAIGKWQ